LIPKDDGDGGVSALEDDEDPTVVTAPLAVVSGIPSPRFALLLWLFLSGIRSWSIGSLYVHVVKV